MDPRTETTGRPAVADGQDVTGTSGDLRDFTVLLVEDDRGDRRLFSRQMETSGLRPEVRSVGTLAGALRVLEQDDVDVVLLDLGLPDSQGLDTLRAVAETGTSVPVVVLTGLADDPTLAITALRHGAHDYLVKGETGANALGRAVRYAIERHQMQRRTTEQLLHQSAMHQLEITGGATEDLQGFAQAAASALQVGLEADRVALRFSGASLPSHAAATAVGDLLTPGSVDVDGEPSTTVELRSAAGVVGEVDVVVGDDGELTDDHQRFLTTATAAIASRVDRLVADLELSARTRQLATVQRVAARLQDEDDPSTAVAQVAAMLVEGLQHGDGDSVGAEVQIEGHVGRAGTGAGPTVAVTSPVLVRGQGLGMVTLLRGERRPSSSEERTVLDGVAAQLGTWWALVRADREHRRDVDRITQLMETAPVGLALVAADGSVRLANDTALELVGVESVDEFPWRFDHTSTDDVHPALVALSEVRTGGTALRDIRLPGTATDGTERVLAVNASPLTPDPSGRRGMTLAISDITEERRRATLLASALEREQEAAEELRQVSELKDGFLRALSHELRTPLASIVGFVETLKDHGEHLTTTQAASMLGRVETNAQRLGMLLEDLLDVGRLTAGVRSSPKRTDQDLAELVTSVVAMLPTAAHDVRLDLVPTPARVDRPKVERIIHNLVGNAVRHTPPGTTIEISTRRDGNAAVFVIDDAGPGIPEDERTGIFEPFVQGTSAASSASPGTGVGLSLVRQFVELHRGAVELEQGTNGGARFTVSLPDLD